MFLSPLCSRFNWICISFIKSLSLWIDRRLVDAEKNYFGHLTTWEEKNNLFLKCVNHALNYRSLSTCQKNSTYKLTFLVFQCSKDKERTLVHICSVSSFLYNLEIHARTERKEAKCCFHIPLSWVHFCFFYADWVTDIVITY